MKLTLPILIAANLIDVISTLVILHHGGRELNPFLVWLMSKIGTVPGLVLPKVVCLAALAYALPRAPRRMQRLCLWSTLVFTAVVAYVHVTAY